MNSMPVPAPGNVSAVAQSPTGTSDQQILQAEQRLNQLVQQFNNLVSQIQLLSRDFILLRNVAVTSVVGTANQVAVSRIGSIETISLTTDVAIVGNFKAGGYAEADGGVYLNSGHSIGVGIDGSGRMELLSGGGVFTPATYFEVNGGGTAGELFLDTGHNYGIAIDGSGNLEISAVSGKIVSTPVSFQALNVYLDPSGGGVYYAASGNPGVTNSFAGNTVQFEGGLLTGGDPTGGGGGAGIPDVTTDSGTHVMYVRQSVTSPLTGGTWESLATFFSGIAPATLWAGATSLTTLGIITAGTWHGTAVDIAYGGTGATTAAAAFDALSPMTTAGDIIIGGASGAGDRLGIGSLNQVLTVASIAGELMPAWTATPTVDIAHGGTGATTAAAAFDALSPMTTAGDIIIGGASGAGDRLGIGSLNQVLTVASIAGELMPAWTATPTLTTVTASTVYIGAAQTSYATLASGSIMLLAASGFNIYTNGGAAQAISIGNAGNVLFFHDIFLGSSSEGFMNADGTYMYLGYNSTTGLKIDTTGNVTFLHDIFLGSSSEGFMNADGTYMYLGYNSTTGLKIDTNGNCYPTHLILPTS